MTRLLVPVLALFAALFSPAFGRSATPVDPGLLADSTGSWVARPTGLGVRIEKGSAVAVDLRLADGTSLAGLIGLGDRWLLAAVRPTSDGSELVMLSGRTRIEREYPAPGDRHGRLRISPIPLAVGGRLHSLLWLEGDRRDALAVRAARWSGRDWSDVTTISPPGRGSQLALAATALAGGELLAAWSAFDGEDDEIEWSRTRDGRWAPPSRVAADNQVPDITPAVSAVSGGALAAWSRFEDGEYVLVGSRLVGDSWSAPFAIGERGSLFPTFQGRGGERTLLWKQASGPGWEAARLDDAGGIVARAHSAAAGDSRPLLIINREGEPEFVWGQRSSAARWTTSSALRPR